MNILGFVYFHLKSKSYFWFGIVLGFIVTLNYPNFDLDCDINTSVKLNNEVFNNLESLEPKINLAKKPLTPKKIPKTFIRPRYYSTELGIREKLFVGVLTSFDNLDNVGIAINITLGNVADKMKYFVQALQNHDRPIPVNNVVGFTDSRETHRPFHVFNYIADNFIQDYDYFFIITDKTFVNSQRLRNLVNKISITEDIYIGRLIPDSSFCSLDAGILLSNNVLQKIKNNLDWCVKNAVSHDHSDNIGRCIAHSSSKECTETVQDQKYHSYKLKHFNVLKHIPDFKNNSNFNKAISIYPIINATDLYVLHDFFSKQALVDIHQQILELRSSILSTVRLHPTQYQKLSWPIGEKRPYEPVSRYDLQNYDLFNATHIFLRDEFRSLDLLNSNERGDISRVLNASIVKINSQYNYQYEFRKLVNGYRLFDPSRGLNYLLDLEFKDLKNGKRVIKRLEICKPLGHSEILPVPYVTENTRITIILPLYASEINAAIKFLNSYSENIMTRREKTFLMLSFLYESDAPSKGTNDTFLPIKKYAQKIIDNQKNGNSKIAWVSIKFPTNYIDRRRKMTTLAIIDLTLRKIGLEALILYLDVHADAKYDFLNRVRMNTIIGYQAFFPIPFVQFNPKISGQEDLDVTKTVGQFDANDYSYFSIYAKDYVKTRKSTEKTIPIVRNDKDIGLIINEDANVDFRNIFDYFIKYQSNLHYFRTVEPSLKIRYHLDCETSFKSPRMGSKTQLAKLILDYMNKKM